MRPRVPTATSLLAWGGLTLELELDDSPALRHRLALHLAEGLPEPDRTGALADLATWEARGPDGTWGRVPTRALSTELGESLALVASKRMPMEVALAETALFVPVGAVLDELLTTSGVRLHPGVQAYAVRALSFPELRTVGEGTRCYQRLVDLGVPPSADLEDLLLCWIPYGDVTWLADELRAHRPTSEVRETCQRFLADGMDFREAYLAASRAGVRP